MSFEDEYELIANLKGGGGSKGDQGDQGLPGFDALPSGEAIAGHLTTSGPARDAVLDVIDNQAGAAAWQASGMGASLQKRGVIIEPGATGSFDDEMVESLSIFFNHEDGGLYGAYTGYGRFGSGEHDLRGTIGLARSYDNGLTWVKVGQLFAGSGVAGTLDFSGATGPTLFYHDGLWHLFYISLPEDGYEGGAKHICLATTTSLVSPAWTRRGAVISPSGVSSGASAWRASGVWHPSTPVFAKGQWHIFFNATDAVASADQRERIGYATADALQGPWTVQDAACPLLSPASSEIIAGDPSVLKIPGGWRMGYYTAGGSGAFDWYTTTTDELFPVGWTAHNAADLTRRLLAPTPGSYDAMFAHKGIDYLRAGRMLHPYTAVDNNKRRVIALAIDPPITAVSLQAGPTVTGTTDGEKLASLLAALSGLGLTVSGVTQWISDDFARGYSATGLDTAPSGQTWRNDAGSWYVGDGIAKANGFPAGSGNACTTIEPGHPWATFKATLTALPAAGLGASLVFRYMSASDLIYVEVKSTGAVEVARVTSGAVVEVFYTSATGVIAAGQELKITQNPATGSFAVSANGVQLATADSLFYLESTRVGIRSAGDYGVGWDAVRVLA